MVRGNPHPREETETSQEGSPRIVSKPTTLLDKGTTRGAGDSNTGPHQLLRSEGQRASAQVTHPIGRTVLAQMAEPPQPEKHHDLGEIQGLAKGLPSPGPTFAFCNMG